MIRGDTVSTFCFGQELQTMDVGLREEDINDVHAYVCKYFDFVRRNMLGSQRNYYDCILEALTASKQKMEPGSNRPIYVILGIFGEHNPRIAGPNGIGLTNLKSLISSAVNIMESKTKNDSSLNGIQDIVDEENVNLLIFTSCLDKLKKEKLYQIMTIAKRSLVVDLDSPACKAHQLQKLLKDFVC
jgi:hypothetical protein